MSSRRGTWFSGWVAVVVSGLAVGTPALAHEEHSHGAEQAGKAAATETVTGEVVDLACYLSEGLRGPGHRECARDCIASGLPVGIKTEDRLYLVMGSEHGPANKALAPLAARTVTARGKVTERDGVHLLAIESVEAAD